MDSMVDYVWSIDYKYLMGIIALLIIVCYLIYITSKHKEDEKYLLLKVFGLYILCRIDININFGLFPIIIPIGYFFYFFFIRGEKQLNYKTKKKASILGVAMLYLGVLSGPIFEKLEFIDRVIITKNKSINYLCEDFESIKYHLDLDKSYIDDFKLEYYKNKKIKYLSYGLIDYEKRYNVKYENGKYSVKIEKGYKDQSTYYTYPEQYMEAEDFLEVIEETDFRKNDDADFYSVIYNGTYEGYYECEEIYSVNLYKYTTSIIRDFSQVDHGLVINHSNMKNVDKKAPTSMDTQAYLVNYSLLNDEDLYKYEDITIKIEDVSTGKEVDVYDTFDVAYIYDKISNGGWAEVSDMSLDIEPDIFFRDNKGNILGFCEGSSFVRRDLQNTSVWYSAPSGLHEFIKKYLGE